MLQTIIELRERKCSCCGKDFVDGDTAYATESGQIRCIDCAEIPAVSHHYLIRNNLAHLKLNRLNFKLISDGIYEIYDRVGQYYIMGRNENGSDPDDIIKEFDKDSFLLEKKDENAVLIFPGSKKRYKNDFACNAKLYDNIFLWFTSLTKCGEPHVLLTRSELIRGISSLPYDKLKTLSGTESFVSSIYVRSTMLKEEILDEYRKAHHRLFTRRAIKGFTPKDMLDYCEKRIKGQGDQLRLAVYLIYKYIEAAGNYNPFIAQNWVLTAPSGSGKTEFFRAVRDFFKEHKIPIPVVQIDLSLMTEEGYRGMDPSTIPKRILEENPECEGNAICFLDEADKKCLPSFSSHGIDTNAAVQSNLLTLIEGNSFKIDDKKFNSERTMFIFLGAFQSVRHQKHEKANEKKHRLGFFTESEEDGDGFSDDIYGDITIQDIIDYGMQEELAGRISQVVNFQRLPKNVLAEIVRDKAKTIGKELGIEIVLTENAEDELVAESAGNMGIRRPMNIIRELAQRAVSDIFFENDGCTEGYNVVINSLNDYYTEYNEPPEKEEHISA